MSNKKIDFKGVLVDFDGKTPLKSQKVEPDNSISIVDLNGVSVLSDLLSNSPEKDGYRLKKIYDWIIALNSEGVLGLDEADRDTLKDLINKSQKTVWVKGQLRTLIDK